MLSIVQIPARQDNYIYVLHCPDTNQTTAIDPTLTPPVLKILGERNWNLDQILITHHHPDHIGGLPALKEATGATVYAFEGDTYRIPDIDHTLQHGDTVSVGHSKAVVYYLPGHTQGHIAYHFADENRLFSGDILFSMGCGRLLEGTASQLFSSLQFVATLPDETEIYCSHEYTEANGRFALSVEPGNITLQTRMQEVIALRKQNISTIPTLLRIEKATNPFLRTESMEIRKNLSMLDASSEAVFTELRRRKDHF